jgi:hypothetical protein
MNQKTKTKKTATLIISEPDSDNIEIGLTEQQSHILDLLLEIESYDTDSDNWITNDITDYVEQKIRKPLFTEISQIPEYETHRNHIPKTVRFITQNNLIIETDITDDDILTNFNQNGIFPAQFNKFTADVIYHIIGNIIVDSHDDLYPERFGKKPGQLRLISDPDNLLNLKPNKPTVPERTPTAFYNTYPEFDGFDHAWIKNVLAYVLDTRTFDNDIVLTIKQESHATDIISAQYDFQFFNEYNDHKNN